MSLPRQAHVQVQTGPDHTAKIKTTIVRNSALCQLFLTFKLPTRVLTTSRISCFFGSTANASIEVKLFPITLSIVQAADMPTDIRKWYRCDAMR